MRDEAQMLTLRANLAAPLLPHGYLVRDLSMPVHDWSGYYAPAHQRARKPVERHGPEPELPAGLRRQAA